MGVRRFLLVWIALAWCAPSVRAEWDDAAARAVADSAIASQDSASRAAGDSLSTRALTKSERRAKAREEKQVEAWRVSAASGFQIHRLGNGLMGSGLGIAALGALFDLPVLWVGGALTAEFGLPIAGIGAGKSHQASRRLAKTRTSQGGYAWPLYSLGWGLLLGSAIVLTSDTETSVDPATGDKVTETTDDGLARSRILAVSGLAAHALAWYGFSKKIQGARANLSRVALLPNFKQDRRGISGAGLTLAMRF